MENKIDLELLKSTKNIYNSLYWELAWKNGVLKNSHWYLETLANNGERCREICGGVFVDFISELKKKNNKKPHILDVGCGPISSLVYLKYENIAEIVGADPLANEYAKLLSRYSYKTPVKQISAFGEFLDEEFDDGEQFDIVFSRNALDHTLSPALTWYNMFKLTKIGGFIIQSHSIREATKEGYKQLHQNNLYPDKNANLEVQDQLKFDLSLTKNIGVELVDKRVNEKDDGHGWFSSIYKKTSDDVSEHFYKDLVKQMANAYRIRSRWAFKIEENLFQRLKIKNPGISPLDIKLTLDNI
jgi:SAM-dependent methyltransferase